MDIGTALSNLAQPRARMRLSLLALLLAACGDGGGGGSIGGSIGSGGAGAGGAPATSTASAATTGPSSVAGSGAGPDTSSGAGGMGGSGGAPCVSDDDCTGDPAKPSCDPATGECVECLVDPACPPGFICTDGACSPGCSPSNACSAGDTCCYGTCFNLETDTENCGACDYSCSFQDPSASCQDSKCVLGPCNAGFADCNLHVWDGCEHDELSGGPCACVPNATQSCYKGPPGTEGVGLCAPGYQACNPDGLGWGPCLIQVLPIAEDCGNALDDDCDGVIDLVPDVDGDGWTACQGDCCELESQCTYPWLVNPGAYEVPGNALDDDCDPSSLDAAPEMPCSAGEALTGVTGDALIKAMDLCQEAAPSPPIEQKKWGVLGIEQRLADGSAPDAASLTAIQDQRSAVLTHLGSGGIGPVIGPTMAGLSTGRMRDQGHPDFAPPSPGLAFGSFGAPPADYLAQHGGALPSSMGCSGVCPSGAGANDSTGVRVSLRTPTNASGFELRFRFLSAEYASRVCSPFNDFFLARLDTAALGMPLDKNVAFDTQYNAISANNVFFEVCEPQGCSSCPDGPADLAGTGFDAGGGATSWLAIQAPITRGETITLDLSIFDVSDDAVDSAVLLDGFAWLPCEIQHECHHDPCPPIVCPPN